VTILLPYLTNTFTAIHSRPAASSCGAILLLAKAG
jgi:hypothetical protein